MNVLKLKQASLAKAVAERAGSLGESVMRRANLLRAQAPDNAARPPLGLFLTEWLAMVEPVLRHTRPPLQVPQASQRKIVVLMPGFGAHPLRMRYMARKLEESGHKVKRWGMGFNFGPSEETFAFLERRVQHIHDRYGQQVVLVGWSLGGVFAREIAKRHPHLVEKVVTMGSPFSHTPYSNNVWRMYQLITGHSVERPPIKADVAAKPPVETVAFWSPRDGVVSARSACGKFGERDRTRALRCSHMGFSNSAEAILAVAEELERS